MSRITTVGSLIVVLSAPPAMTAASPTIDLRLHTAASPGARGKVAQNAPTAAPPVFSASPLSGAAPLAVTFQIRPPHGAFTNYNVDFGDGQAASPLLASSRPPLYTAQHTYASAGSYTAVAGAQVCSPSRMKCAPIVRAPKLC